jgi:hypothetical protein
LKGKEGRSEDEARKETNTPPELLGLKILREPPARDDPSTETVPQAPLVDIVFVHGLGGSAKGTWTHPVSKWFWPTGLLDEEGYENVRISTFGYSANWDILFGRRNVLDLSGFSNQLLDALDLHYRRKGDVLSVTLKGIH